MVFILRIFFSPKFSLPNNFLFLPNITKYNDKDIVAALICLRSTCEATMTLSSYSFSIFFSLYWKSILLKFNDHWSETSESTEDKNSELISFSVHLFKYLLVVRDI